MFIQLIKYLHFTVIYFVYTKMCKHQNYTDFATVGLIEFGYPTFRNRQSNPAKNFTYCFYIFSECLNSTKNLFAPQ